MEHENKYYSSNGKGNLGVTLGAIGTGLGVLNGGIAGLNGILGNNANCGCNEDHIVNRYELGLQQELAAKDTKIALLESNIYVDTKIADVYERLNNKIGLVEAELCQQRVYNATNTSAIACINGQIATLMGLTKTVIPITSVCPEPMPAANSWVAPTATATT